MALTKKIDNFDYIIKDWNMNIKQKKIGMILPEKKMRGLVFTEKVLNEKNEIINISVIDEKILTIFLNKQEILTAMTICCLLYTSPSPRDS